MKKIICLLMFTGVIIGCANKASEESIYALLVSKQNKVVQENYYNGKQETDLINVQSITKSIISLLLGIAIDKGYIASEAVYIQDFFYKEENFINRAQKGITIRHLLNHTSGLEWNGYQEHEAFLNSASPTAYVMDKKMVAKPGELYNYNSGATHMIGIMIEKATGQSCLKFAEENLFGPLGCGTIEWKKLNDGHCDGAGFGLSMQARDLQKIGQLLVNEGELDGKQLIPKQWMNKIKNDDLKRETQWGLKNSRHGYGWYTLERGHVQVLYAMGYGGQFLLVVPSKELVVTALHNHDTPNGISQQVDFLRNSFPQILKKYSK